MTKSFDVADIAKDIAKNIYKETSSSSSKSVSAGGSTAGTVNLGYSQQKTSGQVLSIEWQNSAVVGKGVNIESGADTAFKGANVQGENLNIKTGGDLLVESLQNTYYSNSTSTGFNAGISVGLFKPLGSGSKGNKDSQGGSDSGDSNSEKSADKKSNKNKSFTPSYGENKSKSTRDSMWVNNQTTLIGADSVNIDAQSTHIKGGVIANIDENGVDKGNLSLNTGSLTYEDIFDYDHSQNTSSSWSSSLPINYGSANFKDIIGRNTEEGKEQDINPKGKTTISQARKGHELEQSTHATVGQGAITIDGQEATEEQLAGLNRDAEATQEITKDEITGGLNYNLTIDHEVVAKVSVALAKAGWKVTQATINQIDKLSGGLKEFFVGSVENAKNRDLAALNKHFDEITKETIKNINKELKKEGKKPWNRMSDDEKEDYIKAKDAKYLGLSLLYDEMWADFNKGNVKNVKEHTTKMDSLISEMRDMQSTMLLSEQQKEIYRYQITSKYNNMMLDENIQKYIAEYPTATDNRKIEIAQKVANYMQSNDNGKQSVVVKDSLPEKIPGRYKVETNNISFDPSNKANKTFEGMFLTIVHEAAGHSTSVNSYPVTIGDYVEKINNLEKPKTHSMSYKQPYISNKENKEKYFQNPSEKASIFKSKIALELFRGVRE